MPLDAGQQKTPQSSKAVGLSGFATSAAEAGVPWHRIQQQTGHHTADMVARYVREADPYAASAAVGNRQHHNT